MDETTMMMSPADVKAIMGNNDGLLNGSNGLLILFLFFTIMNGGGYGWNNRGSNGVMDNYVLNSDFAQLSRQIDSGFASQERRSDAIVNGLSSGFYENARLTNGVQMQLAGETAAIQQNMNNGFNTVTNGQTVQGYETRLAIGGVGQQIADVKYAIGENGCHTRQAIAMAARDIIDNQNAGYRSLHDEIVAFRMEDKNAQIADRDRQILALQLGISQGAQTNAILEQLRPQCPRPAYVVQPPQPVNFPNGNYGCSGCGNAA